MKPSTPGNTTSMAAVHPLPMSRPAKPPSNPSAVAVGASPISAHPPPRPGFPFGQHPSLGPAGMAQDPLVAAYAAGLSNNASPAAAAAALGAYRPVSNTVEVLLYK